MISLKTFKKEGVGHVGCRMSLMISSFPQILVGSSTWPDSRPELAARRKAFTASCPGEESSARGGEEGDGGVATKLCGGYEFDI